MSDFAEYIRWRGDISFDALPINEVDSMIFCELCYIPYADEIVKKINEENIPISKLCELVFAEKKVKSIGAILPTEKIYNLLKIIATSERFKDAIVKSYVNDVELDNQKQFCAMWFDISGARKTDEYRSCDVHAPLRACRHVRQDGGAPADVGTGAGRGTE